MVSSQLSNAFVHGKPSNRQYIPLLSCLHFCKINNWGENVTNSHFSIWKSLHGPVSNCTLWNCARQTWVNPLALLWLHLIRSPSKACTFNPSLSSLCFADITSMWPFRPLLEDALWPSHGFINYYNNFHLHSAWSLKLHFDIGSK